MIYDVMLSYRTTQCGSSVDYPQADNSVHMISESLTAAGYSVFVDVNFLDVSAHASCTCHSKQIC